MYSRNKKTSIPKHMTYLSHVMDNKFNSFVKSLKTPLLVGTDCSGIDAPIQALNVMGIPHRYLFASDNDKSAKEMIMCNDKPRQFFDDITTRDHTKLPKVNMYVAGFPCQPFSTLGKRAGFDDAKRGNIFFHCFETIKHTNPDFFILENVKGLTNHDGGQTFSTIIEYLESLEKYTIHHNIYNTMDYGLPQSRERIYIIGTKSKHFTHPKPIQLEISVRDILEQNVTDEYYYELTPHKMTILDELVSNGIIDSFDNDWLVNLNVSSYKRAGARQNVSPCLLAGEGGNCTFFLTSERRRLTNIEYLRLQGFPSTLEICVSRSKSYKQAGNTMSVNVLCFILKNLLMNI
jgi:DNA (cytosine-5)-methyltransferase 1